MTSLLCSEWTCCSAWQRPWWLWSLRRQFLLWVEYPQAWTCVQQLMFYVLLINYLLLTLLHMHPQRAIHYSYSLLPTLVPLLVCFIAVITLSSHVNMLFSKNKMEEKATLGKKKQCLLFLRKKCQGEEKKLNQTCQHSLYKRLHHIIMKSLCYKWNYLARIIFPKYAENVPNGTATIIL